MAVLLDRGAEIAAKHRSKMRWRSGSLTAAQNDISFTDIDGDGDLEVSKSDVNDVYISPEPVMNRSDKLGLALLGASLLCGVAGVVATSGATSLAMLAAEIGVVAAATACLAAGEREEVPVINVDTENKTYRFLAERRRDADAFCDTATSPF